MHSMHCMHAIHVCIDNMSTRVFPNTVLHLSCQIESSVRRSWGGAGGHFHVREFECAKITVHRFESCSSMYVSFFLFLFLCLFGCFCFWFFFFFLYFFLFFIFSGVSLPEYWERTGTHAQFSKECWDSETAHAQWNRETAKILDAY